MSFSPRFTITNAIAAALTRIERARGFLDAAKLSEDGISKMQNRALLLEAHHTTHIEGTHLTLEQSERIFGGEKVQGARPDDAQELLNYKKAIDLVSDYLEAGEARKDGLKDRPIAILGFLLSAGKATVAQCEKELNVNRRTLQRDLKLLVEKGLVSQVATSPTDPTKFYQPLL